MKNIELLCPICLKELKKQDILLKCTICDKAYEIKKDIPILIDMENLETQLKSQVKYFDNDPVLKDLSFHQYAWQNSYIEMFFENVGNVKEKTALDCATGTGYMAIALAKAGCNVIATDLNFNALVRLKNIAKSLGIEENIEFICCSSEKIPLKNDSIDFVIANAILEHLPNDKNAVDSFTRISKKGGTIMVTVPLSYKYLNPLFVWLNKFYDKKIGHLRRYSEDILIEKLKDWKHIRTYYTGHFLKVLFAMLNSIKPIINEEFIERVDSKKKGQRNWASNVISFFTLNDKKLS